VPFCTIYGQETDWACSIATRSAWNFDCLKLEISANANEMRDAGCLCLSPEILPKFTPQMCAAASSHKRFPKTGIFRGQSGSKSSMSVPPESPTALLVMISSKCQSVSICNYSHARLVNST